MGRLMRSELERFEREKVEDFKSGVETFLESAVEAQKEVRLGIALHSTAY
jgi:sorting nexin-1/2